MWHVHSVCVYMCQCMCVWVSVWVSERALVCICFCVRAGVCVCARMNLFVCAFWLFFCILRVRSRLKVSDDVKA